MKSPLLTLAVVCLAGCSSVPTPPLAALRSTPLMQGFRELRAANRAQPAEEAAHHYLVAADITAPLIDGDATPQSRYARLLHNAATAQLTELLREEDHGRLWNRTLDLPGYRLQMPIPGVRGAWPANAFDQFTPAAEVNHRRLRQNAEQPGIGGALVGIHKPVNGNEHFIPQTGAKAPATAVLNFTNGPGGVRNASLALYDPRKKSSVRWQGKEVPLEGDFSAPIASQPSVNELLFGLWGLVRVDAFSSNAGLYFLEPYDPQRIPVVFVHGLLSTPQMWLDTMNELEADPELRGHFQYWAFFYPTGNPISFSAEKLRSELAVAQKRYPMPQGFVLVGHSMGGLLAQMQATTTDRKMWDAVMQKAADPVFKRLPADHPLKKALIFQANPRVKRIVFICTPHRGSDLALGWIGQLGSKLVRLPNTLIETFTGAIGESVSLLTGMKEFRPMNSIEGLSPKSEVLRVLDTLPIQAPYHSIIGDLGLGNSPNSTDGVVRYSSSHLDGAQSEKIVPASHAACNNPQTIAELERILRLQAKLAR